MKIRVKNYFYEHQKSTAGDKLLEVKRNALNPLPGLSFVSIAFYQSAKTGEIYGIIF